MGLIVHLRSTCSIGGPLAKADCAGGHRGLQALHVGAARYIPIACLGSRWQLHFLLLDSLLELAIPHALLAALDGLVMPRIYLLFLELILTCLDIDQPIELGAINHLIMFNPDCHIFFLFEASGTCVVS